MNNLTKTIIPAILILVGIGILSHLVLNKEMAKVTCRELEERDLIIVDIFNQEILYKRIVRDFTETADAMSAVMSIQCLEEETFVINYLKGEDYESITEIIPIFD